MVGYPETPNNPHHLAAFNDLLRVAQLKVTDNNGGFNNEVQRQPERQVDGMG